MGIGIKGYRDIAIQSKGVRGMRSNSRYDHQRLSTHITHLCFFLFGKITFFEILTLFKTNRRYKFNQKVLSIHTKERISPMMPDPALLVIDGNMNIPNSISTISFKRQIHYINILDQLH